ncbi:MAG: alpha/beta hydrolase family protein [Pseudomonadota bacterium]
MHLLFIHGSFHGPWCWEPLLAHLPAGAPVTCAALAMDDASIGLADHVKALADTLSMLSDHALFIVAHSYAGMVLPAALKHAGVTPLATVFFDAFVPEQGDSAFDLLGPMAETVRASAAAGILPPPPPQAFGIEEAEQVAWCADKLRPMALATHEDKATVGAMQVTLGHPIYLRCTLFPGFAMMETRAEIAGWALWHINAAHDAMITAPQELAAILTDLMDAVRPDA